MANGVERTRERDSPDLGLQTSGGCGPCKTAPANCMTAGGKESFVGQVRARYRSEQGLLGVPADR